MTKKVTGKDLKKLIEGAFKDEQLNELRRSFTYRGLPYSVKGDARKVKKALGTSTGIDDIRDTAKLAGGDDDKQSQLDTDDFQSAFNKGSTNPDFLKAFDIYSNTTNSDLKSDIKPTWDSSPAATRAARNYYEPDGYRGSLDITRRIKLGSTGKITFTGKTFEENLDRVLWLLTNDSNREVSEYLDAMMNDSRSVGDEEVTTTDDGKEGELIRVDGLRALANLSQTLVLKGRLDKNNTSYQDVMRRYKASTKDQLTPKASTDRGGLKRQTITSPEVSTYGIESGQMLRSQFEMFDTFIQANPGNAGDAANQLEKRIKALTKFTEDLFKETGTISEVAANPVEGESVYLQFLNKTMILDYFNKMALEMDSMAGAYTFEAFCAYLAGGVSGGKVAGLGGKMGATDFSFADGSKGSAKYLANKDTFSQSAKDFVVGEGVTYIFASKRGEDTDTTTSDPGKIYSIQMYVGTVVRTDEADRRKIKINGAASIQSDPDNYTFKASDFTDAGILYLRTTDGDVITDNLQSLSKKIDNDKGEFFKLFKDTMADLLSAKDSIEIYANKGTTLDGVKASGKLKSADLNFGKFRTAMQKPPKPVTEQKITSNFLKKLIKESFKK